MANQSIKALELMFENFVESFDAACGISRAVKTSYPDPQDMQRANDVFWRPQELALTDVSGLDISAATPADIIDRMVPTTFRQPDNVKIKLTGLEMRDESKLKDAGEAAAKKLSALIDNAVVASIGSSAGITVKKVGAFSWTDGATAETLLYSRGVTNVKKYLALCPTDYLSVAQDLGNKSYMGDVSKSAFENMLVPDIGGFTTMRADNVPSITQVGTVTGTTINGAQSYTPTAMTGDLPTDNRQMVLNVSGANIANIKAGDRFTIAGVNAVHNVTKADTGTLMTFTVKSVAGGGANLTVTPALVASGPYQNVSAQAANGAAVTFLNTVSKQANAFWADGAIALDYGNVVFPGDMGAKVMTARTVQGVPLTMLAQLDGMGGFANIRYTTRFATTVLCPEHCGVILANQT